jgi:hypothetical protein
MDILNNDSILIHQELIHRETSLHLALKQSGLANPHFAARMLPVLGDALCRIGTKLKEHSYRKLTSEEASAPTYMIML